MIFWIVPIPGTRSKYRDKKNLINFIKFREIIRTESIDVNKLQSEPGFYTTAINIAVWNFNNVFWWAISLSLSYRCTLQVDATGSVIASMHWLKNADNKPKRILLYALTVKKPTEKAPSIAIAEHITGNHNVFPISNFFSKLSVIEY